MLFLNGGVMNFRFSDSQMVLKITSVIAIVFCAVSLVLAWTAVNMAEKLQVTPQFFVDPKYLGDSSQRMMIYSLKDASGRKEEGQKILDEMLSRYYIQMRYEQIPDQPEMLFRWGRGGIVFMLSTGDVYKKFASSIKTTILSLPDLVQTVEINRLERNTKDGKGLNSFTIYITLRRHYPDGRKVEEEKRKVTLAFGYAKPRRIFSPHLTNPYGWTVREFGESKVIEEK